MSDEINANIPQQEYADAKSKFDPETPLKMAQNIGKGKMQLCSPIMDGERKYDELKFDFTALTGWEFARAMDTGAPRGGGSITNLTDAQAMALFAAAAAKCTDGLDATDIRERMGAMDAIGAINTASLFFRSSLMATSLRITKE